MRLLAPVVSMFLLLTGQLHAQAVADFYKGKTIELLIGVSAGGGYDAYARILARHMPRFIPGSPAVVPKNMDGAGGLRLANFLYGVAPKDGTTFGTIFRGVAFEPLFGNAGAQFDPTKFIWIGNASSEVSLCVSWHASPIKNFDDLRSQEMTVAASGRGGDAYRFTAAINSVLGTRMKAILGYRGSNEMNIAMERGEVTGRCGWSWSSLQASRPDWVREHKIIPLVQLGMAKHPELGNVPLVVDLATSEEQRNILKIVFARQTVAFPFLAPPDVPADRAAALRNAFDLAMNDPALQEEARKAGLEIAPATGAAVETIYRDIFALPPALIRKAVEAVN